MKGLSRILSIFLMVLLVVGSMAFAEGLTVNEFTTELTVDRTENAYRSAYEGLWHLPVDVNGTERDLYVYTPTTYYPCRELLFIALPSGMSAESFANDSAWVEIAEKYSFCLGLLEGEWSEDASADIDFVIAANSAIGSVVDCGSGFRYIMGYGDGGTMVQRFLLNYPSLFAGAVTLGAADISEEEIVAAGEKAACAFAGNGDFSTTIEGYLNSDVKMPVWVINDGNENQALIEYWKTANNTRDEGLSNAYATVYNQDVMTSVESKNNRAISRVWVSEMEGAASNFDPELTEYIWDSFLSEIYRFSAEPTGGLRLSYDMEEVGMFEESVEVDGTTRTWWTYLPSSYDGSEEIPLVVVFHGYSATSECIAADSEWWRVAEARNLAVVFPQGTTDASSLSAYPRWMSTGETAQIDVNFVNAMLDQLIEEYAIDESRIYATGHSNGGQQTDSVGLALKERFAAYANVGGAYAEVDYESQSFDGVYTASWLIVGEYDLQGQSDISQGNSYTNLRRSLKVNGVDADLEEAEHVDADNGAYSLRTYWIEGAPLVNFTEQHNFHHTYAPSYSWMLWDNFFSAFSRGEDGTLYYCGEAVGA